MNAVARLPVLQHQPSPPRIKRVVIIRDGVRRVVEIDMTSRLQELGGR